MARAIDIYSNSADSAWTDITVDNATDSTAPEVVINLPAPGSTATQNMVHIQVTATDNRKLWSVEICKDGNRHMPIYTGVSTDSVHTTDAWLQDGLHRLTARATDYEGNQADSAEVNFTVVTNTDFVSPWGSFTSPEDNEVVSGPITVQLDAGDNVAVTSVVFYVIDGFDPMLTVTSPPYAFAFDSSTTNDGYHHFRAEIRDSSGNQGMAQTMFEIRQDGDDDSLPDWWEKQHFGGTSNTAADTMALNGRNTLLDAYIAGLDPADPDSAFEFSAPPSPHVLTWSPRVEGRIYSVWMSTNLFGPYEPLAESLPSSQTAYTNPAPPATGWALYQVRVQLE